MLRLLSTYRWELWLVVGIPVSASIVGWTAITALGFLAVPADTLVGLPPLLGSIAASSLLAVSYPRLRDRHGREFLVVVWGYALVTSIVWSLALGAVAIAEGLDANASYPAIMGRRFTILGLALLPQVAALLWFARQASRHSFAHACFLIAYACLDLLEPVSAAGGASSHLAWVAWLVGGVMALAVMLLTVWLLGNFDVRDPGFRLRAVIGLAAAALLSELVVLVAGGLVGLLEGPYVAVLPWLTIVTGAVAFAANAAFNLALLCLLFGMVYLMRVRPAAAPAIPQ